MTRKGKLLLVTYYWPPSGGPGVQRWLKLVKYLVRLGWQVTVYTPSNPESGISDPTLLKDVPDTVRVLQHCIFEPLAIYHRFAKKERSVGVGLLNAENSKQGLLHRLLLWVRANLFIPDARCFWVRPSVRYLLRWLQNDPHDVVITTGPPHSVHLIGLALKRRTNLRWVADFRDPWVNIDYHQHLPLNKRSRARHRALERAVAETADAVSVVAEGMKTDFASYSLKQLVTIFNGFDAEDFIAPSMQIDQAKFRLVYAGSMNADRNPLLLWKVLRNLKQSNTISAANFCVELVGVCDAKVKLAISQEGIDDLVLLRESVPHDRVASLLCQASMLLLCVNRAPTSKAILTGKLFEYLASGRPILAFAPKEGEAAALLARTRCGETFEDNESDALGKYLEKSILQHKEQQLQIEPTNELTLYSRAHQAEQFSALFESLL